MNVLGDLILEPNLEEIEKLANGSSSESEKVVFTLAADTLKAKFQEILENPIINPLVKDLDFENAGVFEELSKRVEKFLKVDEKGVSEEEHVRIQYIVLLIGISYLSLYVQTNFTGPSLPAYFKEVSEETKKRLIGELGRDGENAYHKSKYPHLLLAARAVLVDNLPNLDRLKSACWWNARCLMVHQRILSQKVPSLKQPVHQQFQIITRSYSEPPENNQFDSESSRDRELGAKASLELGLVHHYYRSIQKAKDALQLAQNWSGLTSNLTGMLGKRTRFQTFDNAQLVLEASSSKRDETAEKSQEKESKPREVANEDPTLLPTPTLVNPVQEDNLRVIDQAILLALCLNVKNQNPHHGLTTEEMAPYVRRVQAHPNNWLVYTLGLLIKSRLESESSKTSERAALQFQVLVEQFEDETAPADVRLKHFFEIPFPSVWELKAEVGDRLLSIGAAASALTIFEDLEMWEKIVDCYKLMDRPAKAEEVVRERLAVAPTPELWCALGDLTNNAEDYMTAWELSGKRFSRAMRSLGRSAMNRRDYEKSVEYFTLALAINPLFPSALFSLGCAAMQIQKFDEALNAFSRVVSLEPEEGEAWANMASIYLAQNKMNEAYVSLQEGLKHKRDNWKMWQNFLVTCLEIGEFQQSIYCMHQLLDLRDKEVDIKVLRILTRIVLESVPDRYGEPGSKLQKPVTELFGRVTSKIATNPDIWQVYATLHGGLGHKDKELDCLQKAVRSSETGGWERDEKLFERVASANTALVRAHLASNDSKNIYSAKLKLKSLVKKTEDSFRQTETHSKLVQLLQEVEEKEKTATTSQ